MEAAPPLRQHTAHGDLADPVPPRADTLLTPESSSAQANTPTAVKAIPVQIVLVVLGTITFFYFAHPVVLPIFLACVAAMALKPLIRWLSFGHIPPAISSAFVLCLLVAAIGIGFFQLGRPAMSWMHDV